MTILGKVLIFLNLVAAAAFTYLTTQDWKSRQDLQWARFRGDMLLEGLPVEPPANPAKPDDGHVVFNRTIGGTDYQSIPRERLKDICPRGDEGFGGEEVANQTAEIERLKKQVLGALPGIDVNGGRDRLLRIQTYLLNLARTGAERDGVRGLFDLFDPSKRESGRRDLPFLARTSSQVEALKAMISVLDLGDPQAIAVEADRAAAIKKARDAVKRFALGEVPHAGSSDPDALKTQMTSLLATPGGNKENVTSAAKADGFNHVADVAANPLTTKADVDAAATSLASYAEAKARASVPAEKAAVTAVAALIKQPKTEAYTFAQVDAAATPLLTAYFEDAAAPAAKDTGDSFAGKARKIAHLLYHIDADRHLATDPAVVSARQAWHQRVAWVVGLPMYVQVAEAQASEYAEAAQRLIALITDEETAFKGQYDELVQRIRVLFSRWETVNAEAEANKAITAENEGLMKARETERDKLKKELADVVITAKDALDRLRDTQGRLFNIQRDLRNAQEAILALEKELRRRELGVE